MNAETLIPVPMSFVSRNEETDESTYRVPLAFQGLIIARAVGKLASGDTLTTKSLDWPIAQCVVRYKEGKLHLVCVRF